MGFLGRRGKHYIFHKNYQCAVLYTIALYYMFAHLRGCICNKIKASCRKSRYNAISLVLVLLFYLKVHLFEVLTSLYPLVLCAKLKLAKWFRKEDFKMPSKHFCHCARISSIKFSTLKQTNINLIHSWSLIDCFHCFFCIYIFFMI